MSSQIITYSKQLTTFGTPNSDGNIDLSPPVKIGSRCAVRLINFYIDAQICNIFNDGIINNGLFRISNDGFATQTVGQLENGVYSTVTQITAAINELAASLGWWTNPVDPGFEIFSNTVLGKNYIIIDSTKLAVPGQLCIDFGYNNSKLGLLLGFVTPASFILDNTYAADEYAQQDYIGNEISVHFIGSGYLSLINNQDSTEIARINLSDSSVKNTYSFLIIQQPAISIKENRNGLTSYQVKIYGTRFDNNTPRPIYLLNGSVYLKLEIINY
jgi:hypothetical protein